MLSRHATRAIRSQYRGLAVKAAAVKALVPELTAISEAVDKSGASTYAQVEALIKSDAAFSATIDKIKADELSWTWAMLESKPTKPAVTVAVLGAGSEVGAETLFRIASGEMLGLDQPVTLSLTGAAPAVVTELEGCGFPLLKGVSSGGASGAKYVIALEGDASGAGADALVGVVGTAAAAKAAKATKASVTAITTPAAAAAAKALATSAGVPETEVSNVIAWGTGVADVSHATVGGKWALKLTDSALPAAAPLSAAATADAIIAHMKAWALGSGGEWVSMGVPAVGDYGMGEGFFYSVPVVCEPGAYKRVGGVTLTPEVATMMEKERQAILGGA